MNDHGLGLASLEKIRIADGAVITPSQVHQSAAPAPPENCFHCGLPIPDDLDIRACIDQKQQRLCCYGCQAVAEMIVESGHAHFYRVRSNAAQNPQELIPGFLKQSAVYDNPALQAQFVTDAEGGCREANLMLAGITCAACVWLIERHIAKIPGVVSVQLNYATARARVRWDENKTRLSSVLRAIGEIGYAAYPYDANQQQALSQSEKRMQLRRLAIAGLFGMQIMMISIALYTAQWSGMTRGFETLFRWISLGLTIPVILFAALPFYRAAWYALRRRHAVMDLPVAIAISLAFIASAMATLSGQGEIYYDSISMFTFLLLVGRYFEWSARQKSIDLIERLAFVLPAVATRLDNTTMDPEEVAACELQRGDLVLVRPGETVAADGEVVSGRSSLDESLLNGESCPVAKKIGDFLVGGSINIESPLQMLVTNVGSSTVLSSIQRLAQQSQADKSPLAQFADRVASLFIVTLLAIAAVVFLYWWHNYPERWLEVTLAVLIVSCPCALSLATPAAISAALGKMYRLGILVKSGMALEVLARVTHVVFDKTGTLTRGRPALVKVKCDPALDADYCLAIAAAIESHSEHPLARALVKAAGERREFAIKEVASQPGGGLHASIDGLDYAIGSIEFVEQFCAQAVPREWLPQGDSKCTTIVVLATLNKILCVFSFRDELREDAPMLVQALRARNKDLLIMSGDHALVVANIADTLGVSNFCAGLSPQHKMQRVRELQSQGAVVLMVGDGINDAPVLSAANVSIAMGSSTSIAKTSADVVLLTDQLQKIDSCFGAAVSTRRIVRQNFSWAICYNLCAIPIAASGFLTPWMAAIGMSVSSLIVIANSLRLAR